jgi:hypothetical protein
MTENKFLLVNHFTGECVSSDFIKPLIREVKRWVFNGMKQGQMTVNKSTSPKATIYFHQLVGENNKHKCDICGCEKKLKHLTIVEDSHEVCMAIVCKKCDGGKL